MTRTPQKNQKIHQKIKPIPEIEEGLRVYRFAGVTLGGGKTDHTAVCILEYYPDKARVFLRMVRDHIKGERGENSDETLFDLLTLEEPVLETIAFDAPLQLPKCLRCDLVCPGFEVCEEKEIKWMWEQHEARGKHKRPNKVFTPYTERCAEVYISGHVSRELGEPFYPNHALGANAAPLTARAHYLLRRLTGAGRVKGSRKKAPSAVHYAVHCMDVPKFLEFFPKLSLWQIGRDLKMPKSHLRFHRHAVDSDQARNYFLKSLVNQEIVFIYQQDFKLLVENPQAFDSFLGALTAYLDHRGQTEPRPEDFPKEAAWVTYPKSKISWV